MADLPSNRVTRTLVGAGVTVLVMAGLVDSLRNVRHRASHSLGESWRRLERREARGARHAEIAYLVGRLGRRSRPT